MDRLRQHGLQFLFLKSVFLGVPKAARKGNDHLRLHGVQFLLSQINSVLRGPSVSAWTELFKSITMDRLRRHDVQCLL